MDEALWENYHSELHAVASGLTEGLAKTALKGLYDRDRAMDGFKALVVFQPRFDIKNVGGMLQAFQDVVSPTILKEGDLVEGIHRWEAKVAAVESQYGEAL